MASAQRIYWGKQYPNLPELDLSFIQRESWDWFLTQGIRQAFDQINPIEDFTGKNWLLEFGEYRQEPSPFSPEQARYKGLTYSAPLYIQTQLTNKITGETLKQDVFLGDLPVMTNQGTFIINGVERVVVNQIVRSPGVYFSVDTDPSSGKLVHKAEIRPIRGTWIEFEISRYDHLIARLDRRRKFPVTTLLRAVGYSSNQDLLNQFSDLDETSLALIHNTLKKDHTESREEALIEIYKKLHPGEMAILDNAENLLTRMFFNPRTYDLTSVGRYKINKRLKLPNPDPHNHTLTKEDLLTTIKYLIGLHGGQGRIDDIDHLANRRVRRVGELVAHTALRIGLLRLERSIKEKMSLCDPHEPGSSNPATLVNARPVVAAVNEFFRSNQLSAILDQINPLAEIDNLRRLSVMGSGGITRERASFSIRDISSSQYSRVCPVRSPEGPNIGLVTYLALYVHINEHGFLEAPYRVLKKITSGNRAKVKITDEIVYLAPDDEEEYHITHADVPVDNHGYLTDSWVPMRYQGQFTEGSVSSLDYMDIIPRQVVGTAASLIPFLANDDSIRALMGTHMQCQAVPLVKPSRPTVGTGMEGPVAESMGWVRRARNAGKVIYVDSDRITIQLSKPPASPPPVHPHITYQDGTETYHLIKFKRSSQSTCYNQKPLVALGDQVKKDQLLIDGPACDQGELSLGQNLTVAYMQYDGLMFEDSIIISDRLVHQDLLTSIHIEEYDTEVVDTKLGPEELTRDIPNVSEQELANLAEDGVITIGSLVGPNDILVGKIAPKGETELTAEERLLRAIFGEKAREVRDTSLRMPHGEQGIVVDVQLLDRDLGDELQPGTLKKIIVRVAQMRKITVGDKLSGRHGNKGVISKIVAQADMPYMEDGTPIDVIISPLSVLARMNLGQLMETQIGLAMKKHDSHLAVPVFEHIPEATINQTLQEANLPLDGKTTLYDGRTGEPYETPTTVGVGYILKLIHMVEDKTHARSTGPYSLVTQQPLGGKAQMGGQRLGEMEVWALEGHQAAYTLQEMLTIKSDDVVGRSKAFESIVKGIDIPESNVPESFRVLVKELQSLGIEVLPHGVIQSPTSIFTDDDTDQSDDENNESEDNQPDSESDSQPTAGESDTATKDEPENSEEKSASETESPAESTSAGS